MSSSSGIVATTTGIDSSMISLRSEEPLSDDPDPFPDELFPPESQEIPEPSERPDEVDPSEPADFPEPPEVPDESSLTTHE